MMPLQFLLHLGLGAATGLAARRAVAGGSRADGLALGSLGGIVGGVVGAPTPAPAVLTAIVGAWAALLVHALLDHLRTRLERGDFDPTPDEGTGS